MKIVNMHDAKTHLSRLVEEALQGEPFIIARAGKPAVKVIAVDAPERAAMRRLGFLADHIEVPENFDSIGSGEIRKTFGGK